MLRVQPVFVNHVNNPSTKYRHQNTPYYKEISPDIDYNVNYNNNLASSFNKEKLLQNYKTAREYFNYNFEHKKPIFGTVEDSKLIETNPLVKKNFCKFMVEKSSSELKKLHNSDSYSPDTDFKIKGYTQINKFFKEYLDLLKEDKDLIGNVPAFSGKIDKEEERQCRNLVHGFAAACSLISGGAGALSLGSQDVWLLRPLQGVMFISLQNYLNVPFWAAAEYTAKELYSAAVLGTEGAKILVDVLGWASHTTSVMSGTSVLTGGASHAGISNISALAHGSLSFMLTEKMGRGFLKSVKQGRMTFKAQTEEFASYFGMRAALGGFSDFADILNLGHNTISDSFDPEMIKKAYESIPKGDKDILASLMELLSDYNVSKLGYSFAFNFSAKMLANFKKFQGNENGYRKKLVEDAFKDAFLLTAIYDVFDFGVGEVIAHNSFESINKMKDDLEKYPDVFKVFKESEYKMLDGIDFDKLDEKEFRKMFTNKAFLSNLAVVTKAQIKEFNEAWITKDFAHNRQEQDEINKKYQALKDKNKDLINQDGKLPKNRDDFGIFDSGLIPNINNFAKNRIAGYNNIWNRIGVEFITPIMTERYDHEEWPPEGLLLYGPTNTGKTTMATAIIEQSESEIENSFEAYLPDDFLYDKLCKIEEQAKQTFAEKNRRTLIQIDEIESLSDKPKTLKKLKTLLEDGENRISVIGTTNSPGKVDKDLIKNFLKLYVGPANFDDMKAIMHLYLGDKLTQNLDLDKICHALDSKDSGRFSNNQLKIFSSVIKKKNLTTDKVLSMIKTMVPEISNEKINLYEKEGVNA